VQRLDPEDAEDPTPHAKHAVEPTLGREKKAKPRERKSVNARRLRR
jgi:hypothetical protein